MIIEAAPRLRDETPGAYPPSPTKQLGTKHLPESPGEGKSYQRLAAPSEYWKKKHFKNWGKSIPDLPACGRFTRIKSRKIFHRRHPYWKEDKEKRSVNSINFILSALTNHKCPSRVRSHHRDKAIELLQTFSPQQNYKQERTGEKPHLFSSPIFTANANENNDNCPGTTHNPCEIGVTKQLTSSTIEAEEDCDVEIQDLTQNDEQRNQDTNVWRQRRRSFNTNPLSAPSVRSDKSPFLLSLDELFSKESFSKSDHSRRVFDEPPRKEHFIFAKVPSQARDFLHSEEVSENPTPSIEKLVEFFESNSNSVLPRASSHALLHQYPQESGVQNHFSTSERRSIFRDQSSCYQRNKSFATEERKRPSCPNQSHCRRETSDTISTEFSPFLPKGLESVIRISGRNIPHSVTSTSGGVYNNNGNAASTSPESHLFWPGHNHVGDQQYRRFETARQNTSPSPSPVLFSSDCGPFSSSLGRFSHDIGLEDLNSSRVLTWPGARPRTSSANRRKGASSLHSDNLIDLQTTSARSTYWREGKGPSQDLESVNRSRFKFNIIQSPRKSDKGGERNQSSLCQVQRKESESVSLSANNHHNAPWFGSEDSRHHKDRIQEKHFPFEHLQLHRSLLDPFIEKRSFSYFNFDRAEMGCIQSIAKAKVSPDRCHHGVIVEDIQAAIDRTPTEIEEKSPIVLRYRTPYFRASAHVIVPPIPRKETWTVGWIQACDSMKFINQYGDLGSSSWEIPALKDRRITAVSDSDGVSYPWYGNTTEIATVEGPTETSRSLTLRMNDNFYPSVTWDIPVSEGSEAHLTHIVRDQSFTTWLAAVNQTTGRLEVLRTVKWHFYLEIDVDPTQELGKRARIVSPLVQKQPIILKNNSDPIYISSPQRGNTNGSASRQKRLTNRRPGAGGDNNSNNHTNYIPKSALVRPSANNAQTLIWRPNRDVPVIVVPAKEEYKENNEVVWFTRAPNGHDHNVRILSLQEMSQLKKSIS